VISRAKETCPSIETLSVLLEQQASLTQELERHLGICEACRETLCHLAGEQTWWDQASEVLSEPAVEHYWSSAICALATSTPHSRNDAPLCNHELQQLQALMQPPSHPELVGRIGRYELEQLIGRGGMGLVFRARDTELHRVVAVKTLAIHLVPIGAARERFVREARATASLTHPHIVPVYDVITEGDIPAIVMQYIAGPTLEQKLFESGPLPWQDVLRIGIQLADALVIAHGGDLIHRDIKPGNVLLDAGGARALLTDFGLVRALDDATLTRSGVLAGTPDYMSPEQARGDSLTTSSDLFSLGSLLYAMLTGHPPFRAENPMAVMNRICHEKPRPLRELRGDVPVELAQLVDRLLAKSPRKRFDSAELLAARLRDLAGSPPRLGRPMNRVAAGVAIASICCATVAYLAFATWPTREKQASPLNHQRVDLDTAAMGVLPESQIADRDATSRGDSLVELARLDQQLKQLRLDTDHLTNKSFGPFDDSNRKTPEFDSMDAALWNLKAELNRFESNLFGFEKR
jgi:eukaryotic-like serine/threonine-protein kinase